MKNNLKKGFTIMEIMVAMAITVILVLMVNNFIITGFKTTTFNYEQELAIEHARGALDVMTKEIRGANSSERGDYPLSTITTSTLIFYNDIDRDSKKERVKYYLSSRELKRVVTEPGALNDYTGSSITTTLAQYMNNSTESVFRYYDSSYSETTSINNIRLIKILLKINVTPTRAPADYFVESDVKLRNLNDNNL